MRTEKEIRDEISGITYDLDNGAHSENPEDAHDLRQMAEGMKWTLGDEDDEYITNYTAKQRLGTMTGRQAWVKIRMGLWLSLKGWLFYTPLYLLIGVQIWVAAWLLAYELPYWRCVGLAIALRMVNNYVRRPGDLHQTKKEKAVLET